MTEKNWTTINGWGAKPLFCSLSTQEVPASAINLPLAIAKLVAKRGLAGMNNFYSISLLRVKCVCPDVYPFFDIHKKKRLKSSASKK